MKVCDLESIQPLLPFWLPTMSAEELFNMLSFTGGPYKFTQSQKYLVALRKLELQARKELDGAYANLEEFWADCRKAPQDTMLHIKYIDDPGEFWTNNEDEFGSFPSSGAILIGCEIPSSNKSLLDKKNLKQTWLLLSKEPQDFLKFKGPLRHVIGKKHA